MSSIFPRFDHSITAPKLTLKSVEFLGASVPVGPPHTLKVVRDDGTDYPKIHWDATRAEASPVAYVRNTPMRVWVQFYNETTRTFVKGMLGERELFPARSDWRETPMVAEERRPGGASLQGEDYFIKYPLKNTNGAL